MNLISPSKKSRFVNCGQMGGLISYFTRGWREDSEENLLATQRSTDTALTNPVFDSSSSPPDSYQYSKLVNDDNAEDLAQEQTDGRDLLFQEKTINITLLDSGDRHEEINTVVTAVLQLYKSIETRKDGIRQSLLGFKEALSLSPNSSIEECFKALRNKFSPTTRLELLCAGPEPIKLKITDFPLSSETAEQKELDDNTKKALSYLNACLNHCQKFTGERELKLADIEVKLEDLQLMPLDKDGQTLYDILIKLPSYIEQLTMDISVMLQGMYKAKHILRPQ